MSGGEGENIIKSLLIGNSRDIGVRHAQISGRLAKIALVATWRRRPVEPICAANLCRVHCVQISGRNSDSFLANASVCIIREANCFLRIQSSS